jgi:cysteine protease ATG4
LEKVREEVRKIFWVSYREKFRSLDLKLITSDIGWGCTVRVGQMMILETFRRILQESDLELVMMIQDNLESAPFALREVMRVGKSFGKKPGDWFSPANISYVFTVLLEEHPVKNLKPLLSLNSALYEDQVFALAFGIDRKTARKICKCEENEYEDLGVTCARCGKELTEFHWKFDLFIQIPVMLGLGSVLPEYLMTVKHLLSCPLTVGVIGGKPRMALYLIGFTQDSFLVLDPHFVQKSCKSKEKVEKTLSSYHVDSPKLLKDHDLEGSMSFGFLVNSKQDWNTLKDYLNQPETKGVIVVRENEEVNTLDSSTFERSSFLLV